MRNEHNPMPFKKRETVLMMFIVRYDLWGKRSGFWLFFSLFSRVVEKHIGGCWFFLSCEPTCVGQFYSGWDRENQKRSEFLASILIYRRIIQVLRRISFTVLFTVPNWIRWYDADVSLLMTYGLWTREIGGEISWAYSDDLMMVGWEIYHVVKSTGLLWLCSDDLFVHHIVEWCVKMTGSKIFCFS